MIPTSKDCVHVAMRDAPPGDSIGKYLNFASISKRDAHYLVPISDLIDTMLQIAFGPLTRCHPSLLTVDHHCRDFQRSKCVGAGIPAPWLYMLVVITKWQ